MAFAETLTEFMDTDAGFAEAVTVGGVTGVGIFDQTPVNPFGLIDGASYTLTVIDADFPAAAVGDTVTLRSLTLKVAETNLDGTGINSLRLKP